MSMVLKVEEWAPPGGGDPRWYITLDDRQDNVPCYDPGAKDLILGEDLPAGWEIVKSKAGKDYVKTPSKSGGGGGKKGWTESWYSSEAGTRFTQERTDRRTALMQANDLEQAEAMYEWLRATAGAIPFTPPSPDRPSVGAWGEKVTADPPPVASPPSTGEGVGGSAAKGDGNGLREGADNPSLFAKLSDAYGGGSKGSALALKTARLYYPDAKPKSLSELSEAQVEELIAEAERV